MLVLPDFAPAQQPPPRPGAGTKKEKPAAGSVQISFLPPPLEDAVYSVGVHESKTGKLVRRLHEFAPDEAFTAGLNGFITQWDRRDDAGKTVPAGRYAARGWAVGEKLAVEGVDFLGNEWVDQDEDLRVRRVEAICAVPEDDGLIVLATMADNGVELLRLAGGENAELLWRKRIETPTTSARPGGWSLLASEDRLCVTNRTGAAGGVPSRFFLWKDGAEEPASGLQIKVADDGGSPTSPGKGNTVWSIVDARVVQTAADGTVARKLDAAPGQPTPRAVTASAKTDRLYLLEETDGWQRVRGLEWAENKQEGATAVSEWKTIFERSIRRPDPALGLEDPQAAKPTPAPAVEVTLAENPLAPGKPHRAKLRAGFDEKGSYLETTDGLRLRQISERPNLRAVKLVKGKAAGALTFFQTDGAAWDEFAITGVNGALMTFDAGEFELTATGEKRPEGPATEPRDL